MTHTDLRINEDLLWPNLSAPLELLMRPVGKMERWVAGPNFLLNTGKGSSFESLRPKRCRNPGDVSTKPVWVITPPHF